MKVVLSVRSDVAYKLLTKLLSLEDSLPNVEFQTRNATTLRDLEDSIEFYRADVYIVDKQLEDAEALVAVLKRGNHEYLVIENDVKAILPVFIERFGEKEKIPEIHYEREERQKIVIQEKIIEKEIIRTAYQAIPSKVVVVGSLYPGAGSTVLSTNLARMTAKRGIDVAYVEHPLISPYMFDYLQIHVQEDKLYLDISREIKEEGVLKSVKNVWMEHGVKWNVIDTRMPPLSSFSYENLLVLSHSMQANVLIIDISNHWMDPEIQKFLYLADTILMCVEPDPVKYVRSIYDVPEYQTSERKIMDFLNNNEKLNQYELVLMKDVKGLDNKLVKEMLHKKPIAKVPYIPYQTIQKALFDMKLLYDFEDNAESFEKVLIPVIAKFIPADFIKLTTKRGLVKRLLNSFEK